MNKPLRNFKEKAGLYDLVMTALLAILAVSLLGKATVDVATTSSSSSEWMVILVFGLLLIAAVVFLLSAWRQVKIGPKGVKVKWKFLRINTMKVPAEDIESWELVRESPLASWSGWNVHYHRTDNTVLFFRGRGILLHLKDGTCMLVGIRNLDAAASALSAYLG